MYKYEIAFKGGHKFLFESYLKPSEIVKKLSPVIGRDEIYLLPDDEIINCSEIVYVREVKQ